MAIALLTTYLAPYRVPLYERLADRHGVEVLCFGGGRRYVPPWFSDLDAQLRAAPFPARRLDGLGEAVTVARRFEAVIGPFAGGPLLPLAYGGARALRRPFVLWASVWAQPRSPSHAVALPAVRRIYRGADAIIAYGEHVRRFVAGVRGRDEDIFVAPQAVEGDLFGRPVSQEEVSRFRSQHGLPDGPIVLYVGRLVAEKGIGTLLDAMGGPGSRATLVAVGDGPLSGALARAPGARLLGPLPRPELPVAYAAADLLAVPSVPTPRFREPWGLVCNEAMHAGTPVVASDAVGAVAGGLVRHDETGIVTRAGDPGSLRSAIDRLLDDEPLRRRLGQAGQAAVAGYNYEAMADGFSRALEWALG